MRKKQIPITSSPETGAGNIPIHDQDFHPERSDVEAQMVVAQEGPGVTVKPRCTHIVRPHVNVVIFNKMDGAARHRPFSRL